MKNYMIALALVLFAFTLGCGDGTRSPDGTWTASVTFTVGSCNLNFPRAWPFYIGVQVPYVVVVDGDTAGHAVQLGINGTAVCIGEDCSLTVQFEDLGYGYDTPTDELWTLQLNLAGDDSVSGSSDVTFSIPTGESCSNAGTVMGSWTP